MWNQQTENIVDFQALYHLYIFFLFLIIEINDAVHPNSGFCLNLISWENIHGLILAELSHLFKQTF